MLARERLTAGVSITIMQKSSETVDVVGTAFDRISEAGTVDRIVRAVQERQRLWIVTGNVHYVMRAHRDPEFAALISQADLRVADGVPILWAARLLGKPLCGRVNGTDLVWHCAEISAKTGCTVALVGSTPEIAAAAAERLASVNPGAEIIAVPTSRPLTTEGSHEVIEHIQQMRAAIVLVALTTGKQEQWIAEQLYQTSAPVLIGIGSALDIISGRIPRAPRWMQRNGLEWLFRLSREPGRLWRRYLWEDAPFVWLMLGQIARHR